MALTKSDDKRNGPKVGYWTLAAVRNLNYTTREVEFTLLGFKDESAAKTAGTPPLETRDVKMRGEEFDRHFPKATEKNLATQCYEAAVAKDELFADAAKS